VLEDMKADLTSTTAMGSTRVARHLRGLNSEDTRLPTILADIDPSDPCVVDAWAMLVRVGKLVAWETRTRKNMTLVLATRGLRVRWNLELTRADYPRWAWTAARR